MRHRVRVVGYRVDWLFKPPKMLKMTIAPAMACVYFGPGSCVSRVSIGVVWSMSWMGHREE